MPGKNWFKLLAVRISSYGCTWQLESLESTQEARGYHLEQPLRFSPDLQTFRAHP